MHLVVVFLIFNLIVDSSFSQISYNCALPQYCDDYVNIDLRIQTPESIPPSTALPSTSRPSTSCPANYIQCTNVKCGYAGGIVPTTANGAATQGAFPWHVYLENAATTQYIGGGVLINQYFVLTAAHKVVNTTSINAIMGVYLGTDVSQKVRYSISSKCLHKNYSSTFKNDIALLRLATPVNLGSGANILCLPTQGRIYRPPNFSSDGNCIVVGFGQTTFNTPNSPHFPLKQAYVPIVTADQCIASLNNIRINVNQYFDAVNEICAGGRAGIDACTNDGGSGLVCRDNANSRFSLVGLVIWGKGCAEEGRYGVYVNVPSYISWINTAILNFNSALCQ